MFDSGMRESSGTIIEIPNASYQNLLLILVYLYAGNIEDSQFHKISVESLLDLILLAHSYNLARLVRIVEKILIKQIQGESATQIYQVSHLLGLTTLQEECVTFLATSLLSLPLKTQTEMAKQLEEMFGSEFLNRLEFTIKKLQKEHPELLEREKKCLIS